MRWTDQSAASPAEIALLGTPVTLQNFYGNIHYSHATTEGDEAQRFTPNEKSAGSEAKIAQAEQRLGLRLPEALRALYLVQNGGGGLATLCVPNPECVQHFLYDHITTPFSGYSDLNPLEYITTLHEAMCDYADPEAEAERFPAGCERMIILARWYEETLYLDYNQLGSAGEPAVCFTTFEDQRLLHTRCWPDFAAFFAALRVFKVL
jgi:SMI1 / KNR4 family (SUKH-1)